jgi:hypothetical protein
MDAMLKLFSGAGGELLALEREIGEARLHILISQNSVLLRSPRKTMRGDVEKLSRGIGAPLISLKREPHGVFAAKVVILCGNSQSRPFSHPTLSSRRPHNVPP